MTSSIDGIGLARGMHIISFNFGEGEAMAAVLRLQYGLKWQGLRGMYRIRIAALAPISTHQSYFEVINDKIINHLPRSIIHRKVT